MHKRWFAAIAFGIALQAQAAPQRIVSLLPSLTETVCVLGHCDALVAVDDFSSWPESVRRLPRVGGLDDANVERIVAMKPDLVLLAASTRAMPRLQALGIPVLAVEPKVLADVHTALEKVGSVLGEQQRAARAWQEMNDGIDAAASTLPHARRGTRVYFEVDSGPYAAGATSHIGELFLRLGVANIVPANLGSVPKLNPEFVVRADPQVIVIARRDAPEMRSRPGWQRISAIREGRVCMLDREQGDAVARPGPRLAEAARILAQCISR